MNIGLVTVLIIFSILKFIRPSRKSFIFNTIALNNSNVLFADEDIDVTNDLLTYINKKYEGLK